jgi:DUF971 family protein
MNGYSDPEKISISKSRGIHIGWKDGHVSDYGLQYLRDKCPCASCTGAHGTPPRAAQAASPFPMFQPALRMTGAEPVGSYALRIAWSDGHSSGIYSWEHLRSICPCPQCSALRERGAGTE